MKCSICQSETPPQYPHGVLAVICHTCKVLGRVVEAAFSPDSVEPEEPVPEEQPATQTSEAPEQANPKVEEPAAQEAQAEQSATTESGQTDVDTGKRKTKKLK
jgi:hypothetical protein